MNSIKGSKPQAVQVYGLLPCLKNTAVALIVDRP